MTTIRVKKHERNFTIIQNEAIQDAELSLKARGLHHLLLSYPNDWVINVKHLSNQSKKDGPDAIRSALKELEVSGYLERDQSRDDGKFSKATYVIYEVSQNPCKQKDLTVSGFSDDGLADDGKSGDILSTISTKNLGNKNPYRTAFSSKSAASKGEEVFSDFGQEALHDNCTSTLVNSSANGQTSSKQKSKNRSESSRKPNKPEKRKLFDGTFGLSCDHNGWIKLPSTLEVTPEYRDVIGLVKAQAITWMKVWFVGHHAGELELTLHYSNDGEACAISGKDFDLMPYDVFLGKDGPISVQLMRDVLTERIGGFQEEFNDQMNEFFWKAWYRFESKVA